MSDIVRADTLRGFREVVGELGGDADALLHDARIEPVLLTKSETYISFRAVAGLMERAAIVLERPDFGMRFGMRRTDDALGPLAIVMQNAHSARDAIVSAERFLHFHNPTLKAALEEGPDAEHEFLLLEHQMRRAPRHIQAAERMLTFSARFIGLISGGPPKEVWFRHARCAPLAAYKDAFAPPILRFSMPKQGLVLAKIALDAPRAGADAQLKRMAEHFLENTAPAIDQSVKSRARAVVDRMMRDGGCTQADLARALGLHERTLQRRLQAEDTSFEAIKDEVRQEMAKSFLAQPNVPISQIAEFLDYAEMSALTRSCRRWFGLSPRALRKALLAEAA